MAGVCRDGAELVGAGVEGVGVGVDGTLACDKGLEEEPAEG